MDRSTHLLYIDDSGQKEYAPDKKTYGHHRSRHFVFGGLLVTRDGASSLAKTISELKTKFFGSSKIEVKSNWLRIPDERRVRYLEPFALTEEKLNEFTDEFYRVISESDLQLMASVVDKLHMHKKYAERAWYPPAIAYDALLQRAENELRNVGSYAVFVDEMTGKTKGGREYKENLRQQHKRLKRFGSPMRSFAFNALEGDIRFLPSESSHLIQVADIAAYNVFRQFRDNPDGWESPKLKLELYKYLGRMLDKFRMDDVGRIQGYGIAKVPLIRRVRWRLPWKRQER